MKDISYLYVAETLLQYCCETMIDVSGQALEGEDMAMKRRCDDLTKLIKTELETVQTRIKQTQEAA